MKRIPHKLDPPTEIWQIVTFPAVDIDSMKEYFQLSRSENGCLNGELNLWSQSSPV
jgi:hypothetical protein